jgi:outer membrane autotransporter protein
VLNGDAIGSFASGATNNLILEGQGTASNHFQDFHSLDVQASGTWVWNNNSTIGGTTISSGTLAVDGGLTSPININSGATLAGKGTVIGTVFANAGATIAPGAAVPFSNLTVNGDVNFLDGSVFKVNVNAARRSDTLTITNGRRADLSGGTVNVLAQSGIYRPSTQYTILSASGGFNHTRFAGVAPTNLAFLTPSLTYDDDDHNVFLTLTCNPGTNCSSSAGGGGFATVAQTQNQTGVATALNGGAASNPLVIAILNQTADGARQAFGSLSGEIFGSVHNTQAGEMQFARSAMLGRMRQASYAGAPGELAALAFGGPELAYAAGDARAADFPVKAPYRTGGPSRDLTFWAQGLGGWGRSDSDGNAASVTSRFGGFLSGVDAWFGDAARAGFVAGYQRSDLHVDARASSAGIDSVQVGAYAGGRLGALNVRGGASYSFDSIDTSRTIAFPGFIDQTHAKFHGHVAQVFGEVGYGMTFNQVAVEPLAGLAYVHLRDGGFLESGGAAALSGASARENIGYSFLGARAATTVLLANGTVLIPRGSLQWQHAFGDVTPSAALAFQGTGTGFSVAGVPIARNTALIETGFDWRFSPWAKLGAFYQGELAAHAQVHAFKGVLNWQF